jgi:SAM-dependent methyltransferase
MSTICELCRHDSLEAVYEPDGSTRGLKVHVCLHCGLVQSLPRIDRAPCAPMAVSGGADWGNVRYGKAFRTAAVLALLRRHADLNAELSLLDVGSNRGSFVRAFVEAAPSSTVVAVEPDARVAPACDGLDRVELIGARIEDVALETARFHVVHSCHTIEHLAEPARVLADHWRVLKPGGLLILDAPNIGFLDSEDVVEEWFIDKHLYHFSARTLMRLLEACGFEIVSAPDISDRENLLLVARKSLKAHPAIELDRREVAAAQMLITTYVCARARNLAALAFVAAEIAAMKPKRVAIWGAGRIFDSVVTHGRLVPGSLTLLVDAHLKPHVAERYGCPLAGPEELASAKPDVVVVMSRGFADEIARDARRLLPHAEIVTYADMLQRAHARKAA